MEYAQELWQMVDFWHNSNKTFVSDNEMLQISPSSVISFVKEGDEYASYIKLQNNDPSVILSYKMKTTAPEKFRVKPSAGVLSPGDKATICVTLLPAYHVTNLEKDKFLVMTVPVENAQMNQTDLTEFWKSVSGKSVSQHRLRCTPLNSEIRNGSAYTNSNVVSSSSSPTVNSQTDASVTLQKLTASVAKIHEAQHTLNQSLRNTQYLQMLIIFLITGFAIVFFLKTSGNRTCTMASHPEL